MHVYRPEPFIRIRIPSRDGGPPREHRNDRLTAEAYGWPLKDIVFHAKLGTQWDRVQRIERLAGEIAERIGADVEQAKLAARLCKADLVSGTVGEFPEVQGIIGGYLARAEGLPDAVADAIADHYRPQGPNDRVPTAPVTVAVALADKLDTVMSFFAVGERPTGSKDPFALRRAELGQIRAILTNEARLQLRPLLLSALEGLLLGTQERLTKQRYSLYVRTPYGDEEQKLFANVSVQSVTGWPRSFLDFGSSENRSISVAPVPDHPEGPQRSAMLHVTANPEDPFPALFVPPKEAVLENLDFVADRLKVLLRESGAAHDLVDSVFALGDQDDLVLLVRRVEALQYFLAIDDGKNLLAGYKRAANILRIEEKKDKHAYDGAVDAAKLTAPEEKALFAAIEDAAPRIESAIGTEEFAAAMAELASLRGPVDAFFEKVTVNDPDPTLRANRLNLLARIKAAAHLVADFSKIEG